MLINITHDTKARARAALRGGIAFITVSRS